MKRILSVVIAIMFLCYGCSGPATGGLTSPETSTPSLPLSTSTPAPEKTTVPAKNEPICEFTYSNATLYKNSIGAVWVQTIVEFENTGDTAVYASSGSYDLEDDTGKLIASQSMVSIYPNVIAPGEKGYMYDETILEDVDASTKATVLPHIEFKAASIDIIRLDVTDFEMSDDKYGGLDMLGRIVNTTDG